MRLLQLAAVAVLTASCAKDLNELGPFACAQDGTCPRGLACVPGVGCTRPRLDALCGPETSCAAAGEGAACAMGLCTVPCAAPGGCGDGRVCSSKSDDGVCLADCTRGEACPTGLVCQDLRWEGRRGCLPPSVSIPACGSQQLDGAARGCGQAAFNVPCQTSGRCVENSVCLNDTGSLCRCKPGYVAVSCTNNLRCSSTNPCAFPNWWCLPRPVEPACAAAGGWTPGTYACTDGRQLFAGCGPEQSCEAACSAEAGCDPVRQDCPTPGDKCTLTELTPELDGTVCVAAEGSAAVGSACSVTDPDAPTRRDTCAPGGFCTGFGASSPLCRKLCRFAGDCPASENCLPVSRGYPVDGICMTACQFFSSTCGAGTTCSVNPDTAGGYVGYCRPVGATEVGGACASDDDCVADAYCDTGGASPTCVRQCDDAHACANGSCQPFPNASLAAHAGHCE